MYFKIFLTKLLCSNIETQQIFLGFNFRYTCMKGENYRESEFNAIWYIICVVVHSFEQLYFKILTHNTITFSVSLSFINTKLRLVSYLSSKTKQISKHLVKDSRFCLYFSIFPILLGHKLRLTLITKFISDLAKPNQNF